MLFVKLELGELEFLFVLVFLLQAIEVRLEFLEFFGGLEGGNGDRHQNAADDEGEENDGKAEVVTGETIEKDQQLIDGVNDEI